MEIFKKKLNELKKDDIKRFCENNPTIDTILEYEIVGKNKILLSFFQYNISDYDGRKSPNLMHRVETRTLKEIENEIYRYHPIAIEEYEKEIQDLSNKKTLTNTTKIKDKKIREFIETQDKVRDFLSGDIIKEKIIAKRKTIEKSKYFMSVFKKILKEAKSL